MIVIAFLIGLLGFMLILISVMIDSGFMFVLGGILIISGMTGIIYEINEPIEYHEVESIPIDTVYARPNEFLVVLPDTTLKFTDYNSIYAYVFDSVRTVNKYLSIEDDGSISNVIYYLENK